jgi:hypothetical protein
MGLRSLPAHGIMPDCDDDLAYLRPGPNAYNHAIQGMMDHDMTARGVLYLLVGLPGAGKTTRAREIERTQRALRFSPDVPP